MQGVDLSIVERFACPQCKGLGYVRLMVIEVSADKPSWRCYMPPAIRCPHCTTIYDPSGCEVDNLYHWGFQCDSCGEENLQSGEKIAKQVKCADCGAVHASVYTPYLRDYWRATKKGLKYG